MLKNPPSQVAVPPWLRWVLERRAILICLIAVGIGLYGSYRNGVRGVLSWGIPTFVFATWAFRRGGWVDQITAMHTELQPSTMGAMVRTSRFRRHAVKFPLAIGAFIFVPAFVFGPGTWEIRAVGLATGAVILILASFGVWRGWKRIP